MGPIADQEPGKIRDSVQQLIQSQGPELAAAIRTGAQTKANQLKAQLTNQVANRVTSQLNRSFSFYDDWFDPLIGLRGRFNLNKAFYLTAESDVGGFGIGSDMKIHNQTPGKYAPYTRCRHRTPNLMKIAVFPVPLNRRLLAGPFPPCQKCRFFI